MDENDQPCPPGWRKRTASAARRLSLACDVAALACGGGTEELVFKATGLALRTTASILDRPTKPTDHGG